MVKDKQQQTKPFVLEDLSCRSVTAMPFFKCPQQSANIITLTVKEMFSLPVRISNTVKNHRTESFKTRSTRDCFE